MGEQLEGRRILITGASGQVAFPVARDLVRRNQVFALGRFRYEGSRKKLEDLGVGCVVADLGGSDPLPLPDRLDHVLHFANSKSMSGDFDEDIVANVEGLGRLMAASAGAGAKSFLHCSSAAVYQHAGQRLLRESDPLGDNHRVLFPTYSICKIAAEAMVRFGARQFDLPATIARLSVPYGDNGGWPAYHLEMILSGTPIAVHPDRPALYNPLHEDDYIAQIPRLLAVAAVPATIVNWGGSEAVSLEDWCEYLGELVDMRPQFVESESALAGIALDTTRMRELLGATAVNWRDGMRRMVRTRHPEIALH